MAALHAIHVRLRQRRHTALLVALLVAFATRPLIGDTGAAPFVFGIALLLLMLVALYTIQVDDLVGERGGLAHERRRRSFVAWVLVAFAFAERLATFFSPNPSLLIVAAVCWFLFFAFVTWNQLRSLLRQKQVTNDTLSMAVSVYLLMGLTWGVLYIVIFELQPGAFSLGTSPDSQLPLIAEQQHLFPVFIYFSMTTLATIGYGDIAPVSLQARYIAVAEGIVGQFYLAILVARLVGLQMSQSAARDTDDSPRAAGTHSERSNDQP